MMYVCKNSYYVASLIFVYLYFCFSSSSVVYSCLSGRGHVAFMIGLQVFCFFLSVMFKILLHLCVFVNVNVCFLNFF